MSEPYDILVQNATIVDGTGQPAYTGSVGIRGEKVVAVGETGDQAARAIDGSGLIACMMHPLTDPYWMDCIQIVRSQVQEAVGRTIGELARERAPHSIVEAVYEVSWEVVFDLLVEDPDTTCADHIDKREYGALSTFLAHPAGMPCTDVGALPAQPPPQPKQTWARLYTRGVSPTAYGLFPHYLRTFVVEKGALSLEEAVRKATSLPAGAIGLPDRGRLAEGAYADVVVFDLETLRENTDFRDPAQAPQGIRYVLVNGQVVCENGAHTGARPGKVLRHS